MIDDADDDADDVDDDWLMMIDDDDDDDDDDDTSSSGCSMIYDGMYIKEFVTWLLFCIRDLWSDQWALSQMLQLPVKHRVICSLLMYWRKCTWIGKHLCVGSMELC